MLTRIVVLALAAAPALAQDWLPIGRIGVSPAAIDVSKLEHSDDWIRAPMRLGNTKTTVLHGQATAMGCGAPDGALHVQTFAGVAVYRWQAGGDRGVDETARVLCGALRRISARSPS